MSHPLDETVKIILEGLITDGAHHKQWYLEQVLQSLVEPEYYETCRKEFEWDEGIAP